jgi:hypothetical protein
MAKATCNSLFFIEPYYLGETMLMLKKKIVVATIMLGISLPSLSNAVPLSWAPGPDVIAKLSRLWDLLPGKHAPSTRPARQARKNGCGMDPNGAPLCGGGG